MNIYFVCTGNTCRSPMAEAILNAKKHPKLQVRSAGIYAMEGKQMSENAQRVLNEENIPHQHISRQVNTEDIEWADLILTMTSAHKELLIRNFESALQKTFTLKEYVAASTQPDVVDPYGGDVTIYQQTLDELKNLIDVLLQKLEGEIDGEQQHKKV